MKYKVGQKFMIEMREGYHLSKVVRREIEIYRIDECTGLIWIKFPLQAAKWTAEGAVNSHYFESAQYSATWGIRQLPGICRYSAKRTVQTVKQGGTAGSLSYARP